MVMDVLNADLVAMERTTSMVKLHIGIRETRNLGLKKGFRLQNKIMGEDK